MRVVAGDYGGRRLVAVPGNQTRPTTDKIKESLFNMIGPYFEGGICLDLFAGSGGLSIEAVSRGIAEAYLVDRQFAAIQTIKKNIEVTKNIDKFHVSKSDAFGALRQFQSKALKFDLVFLDPPYRDKLLTEILDTMQQSELLQPNAVIVYESDTHAVIEPIDHYEIWKQHTYGITELTIFRFREGVIHD